MEIVRYWRAFSQIIVAGFFQIILVWLGLVPLLGLGWILGPGAAWVLEHFDGVRGLTGKDLAAATDAVRGRALAIATGLIALGAVYYTARNADTARQGHITDRYTKAIEQLGSDKLDIRLGGIYALERIARDSARDHPTVMEVLAAFVREHSRDVETDETRDAMKATPRRSGLRTDLQAAVTVIGRRLVGQDSPDVRISLARADLTLANLVRMNLTGVNFTGADLTGADLALAGLTLADLTGADLTGAKLTLADLTGADLTGAKLTGANLTGVTLTRAMGLPAHLRSVPGEKTGATEPLEVPGAE
ncbi:pentapeptide repeat-containing protein [Streptosporangium sp. 'caverna']|uniref:pentapeptide repeat-containing protein n=1 Tax=Streptosporangium sp. 'caverna' TaxID=2202249 RepID=UPI0013A6EC1B|nr:pentapeptide repeat-containing protein [Streptosporangium sp. 'caverna']